MRTSVVCVFILICTSWLHMLGQDLHFSNNEAARSFNNFAIEPLVEDFQATLAYRQQYTSVPVSYITSGAGFIGNFYSFTAGVNVLSDKAGDASWQSTQLQIPIVRRLMNRSRFQLGVMVRPGVSFSSFNASALTFNSQFNGDAFNAAAASGESFTNQSFLYYHSLFGFATNYVMSKKWNVNLAYSFKFNTAPNRILINNIAKRSNANQFYLRSAYVINAQKQLSIECNVSIQKKFNQQLISMKYSYKFSGDKLIQKLSVGAGYRMKDAMIFYASMQMKNIELNFAYDVNSSSFTKATNGNGATEMIIVYRFFKKQGPIKPKPACPVFI